MKNKLLICIYKILKFILKSIISIVILILPALISVTYFPHNLLINFILALITFVCIWVVLNYTSPEEIIEFIVAILIGNIAPCICEVVINCAPKHFHYPIRSKRIRFNTYQHVYYFIKRLKWD